MDLLQCSNYLTKLNTTLPLNGPARTLNGFTSRLELLNETMNTT